MKKHVAFIFSSLVVFTLTICISDGQSKSSTVKGTVADQLGAVIAGIPVNLKEQGKADWFRKTTTNVDGVFTFFDLPPGEYVIEVKPAWVNRSFVKQIKVGPSQPSDLNIVFSLEPCSDEPAVVNDISLTENDRATITRESINLRFPNFVSSDKLSLPKLIFSDVNLRTDWLSTEQKERITVMSRFRIQAITDKTGEFVYYSVSKISQRGSCVSISLLENWTVKGQIEDANMAGGGTTYEFRKVNGSWVGTAFGTWIS